MKFSIVIIFIGFLASCQGPIFNTLEDEVNTIDLSYIAWACECANWSPPEDHLKFKDNIGDSLALNSIFIEPATIDLELPDTLGYSNDLIRFKGQFYEKKGYPEGYFTWEDVEEARVFRYTEYQVLISNHASYMKEQEQY